MKPKTLIIPSYDETAIPTDRVASIELARTVGVRCNGFVRTDTNLRLSPSLHESTGVHGITLPALRPGYEYEVITNHNTLYLVVVESK